MAVEAAARRWEQIITHDVPNHSLSDNARIFLNELYPGITVPDNVDDLLIYVKIAPIDGAGGTLGQAGSDVWRVRSALPIVSFIELDASDLDTMSDQLLAGLILHEIGHTLGFGIDPWTDHNLLQNPSLGAYNNRIVPAPDTHFSGANAIAAFNAAGGTSYTGAKVPVENTLGGSGSRDKHWRESVLDDELMTPRIGGACAPAERDYDSVTRRYRLPRRCRAGRRLHGARRIYASGHGVRGGFGSDQLCDHNPPRRRAGSA